MCQMLLFQHPDAKRETLPVGSSWPQPQPRQGCGGAGWVSREGFWVAWELGQEKSREWHTSSRWKTHLKAVWIVTAEEGLPESGDEVQSGKDCANFIRKELIFWRLAQYIAPCSLTSPSACLAVPFGTCKTALRYPFRPDLSHFRGAPSRPMCGSIMLCWDLWYSLLLLLSLLLSLNGKPFHFISPIISRRKTELTQHG